MGRWMLDEGYSLKPSVQVRRLAKEQEATWPWENVYEGYEHFIQGRFYGWKISWGKGVL